MTVVTIVGVLRLWKTLRGREQLSGIRRLRLVMTFPVTVPLKAR